MNTVEAYHKTTDGTIDWLIKEGGLETPSDSKAGLKALQKRVDIVQQKNIEVPDVVRRAFIDTIRARSKYNRFNAAMSRMSGKVDKSDERHATFTGL